MLSAVTFKISTVSFNNWPVANNSISSYPPEGNVMFAYTLSIVVSLISAPITTISDWL